MRCPDRASPVCWIQTVGDDRACATKGSELLDGEDVHEVLSDTCNMVGGRMNECIPAMFSQNGEGTATIHIAHLALHEP